MTAQTGSDAPAAALRPPVLGQGLVSAVLAAGLFGLAVLGHLPLVAGIAVLQLVLALGFLALVDAPSSGGVFLLGLAAAAGADLVVELDDGRVGGLAGVVALSFVGGLLHQLLRRERSRVTESLADTLVVVTMVCSSVCLAAAVRHPEGVWAVRVGLAAAGIALLAGRFGDAVVSRPALATGATRAWPGLLLGLGAGVALATALGDGHLSTSRAALIGLSAAAAVAAADLAVDLAAAELTSQPDDARRVAALRPVSTLLPFAVLGPVVLLCVVLLERS
ncbi:MAG: hypothetical protein JWO12_2663 [Frankiales bacterium]|nr:hypothetical protein [Frankiales bacterium]